MGAKVRSNGMLGEWIWDGPDSVQNALFKQSNEDRWWSTDLTEDVQDTVKAI